MILDLSILNRTWIRATILVAAIIAAMYTTTGIVQINTLADLQNMRCGWPFAFLLNDQSYIVNPTIPGHVLCSASYADHPPQILWPLFFVDVLIFYAGIFTIVAAGTSIPWLIRQLSFDMPHVRQMGDFG